MAVAVGHCYAAVAQNLLHFIETAACSTLWWWKIQPDHFCPNVDQLDSIGQEIFVCALLAEDKLVEAAYNAPAGPITPLDILYGHRPQMARGNLFMAHRCGFTQKVVDGTLRSCGFQTVASMARGRARYFDLWALASKSARTEDEMRALVGEHFPV